MEFVAAGKTLQKMREHQMGWRIEELQAVAVENFVEWRRPGRGGSHVIFSAPGVREIVSVPAKRPNFYPNLYNPANAAILNSVNNSICTAIIAGQCTGITPAAAFGPSPNPVLNGVNFYLNGIGRGGVNGIPTGLVNNHWANFGARTGFAYDQ